MMSKELFGFDTDKQWDYENGFYLTSHWMDIGNMTDFHNANQDYNKVFLEK